MGSKETQLTKNMIAKYTKAEIEKVISLLSKMGGRDAINVIRKDRGLQGYAEELMVAQFEAKYQAANGMMAPTFFGDLLRSNAEAYYANTGMIVPHWMAEKLNKMAASVAA